ncbi:NlpC/P60 family protein [Kitasatospora sp. NPDC058965]|uniref:C40 family peptidase n=1 Tax=Kitasatospora sp. NPDC058965 TaxID=3346682 RepID=UPI00368524D0
MRRDQTFGSQPWLRAALRCGAVLAVAALALPAAAGAAFADPLPAPSAPVTAPAVPGVSAGADPLADAKATLGPLLDKIHLLYQNAEVATEQYNATAQKLAAQQSTAAALDKQLADQQSLVDTGTDVAAELAADQYQNGNLSAYGQLLLTEDPYQVVHLGELLAAAGRSQAAFVAQLKAEQGELQKLKDQSAAALSDSTAMLAQQDQNKTEIARQLATVEQLVSGLTGAQQQDLELLEKQQADDAQMAFLASGALGQGERTPSAAGRQAVAWALQQLGKPYEWGAIGPGTFDCSGLTSQAWLHAGKEIPRTSQDQWAALQHVPLNQLRPGDLVLYNQGATHVAMYIGGGLVVVAPHTGAVVRVSPIGGAGAILGAVRPDPESGADDKGGTWKVPDVLQNAQTLTPIAPSLGTVQGLPAVPPLPALLPVLPVTPPQPTAVPSPVVPSPSASGSPSGSGSPDPSASGSPSPSSSPDPSASASGSPSGSAPGSPSGTPSGTSPSATPSH